CKPAPSSMRYHRPSSNVSTLSTWSGSSFASPHGVANATIELPTTKITPITPSAIRGVIPNRTDGAAVRSSSSVSCPVIGIPADDVVPTDRISERRLGGAIGRCENRGGDCLEARVAVAARHHPVADLLVGASHRLEPPEVLLGDRLDRRR